MPALHLFLRDELARRGWTMEEFVSRAQLSLSAGYLIVRDGKDNVRRETFENIAAALGMTPATLMVAIGKGAESDDPERATLRALIDSVPREDLGMVDRIVRPFALFTHAKKRRDRITTQKRENNSTLPSEAESGPDSTSLLWWTPAQRSIAFAGAPA